MTGEHLAEQLEFGHEVLGFRLFVDDRNASERLVGPLCTEFLPEHVDEHLPHVVDASRAGEEISDFAATGLLRRCDVLQEQCTARVRVDLDQARAVRGQVEVVTEEYAAGGAGVPGDVGCPPEDGIPVGREGDDVLDRVDDCPHCRDMLMTDEDREIGQQVGMRLTQAGVSPRLAEADGQ